MNSEIPEIQRLRNRIRQFEEHRNRSILRDLELSLQALEYLATYGRCTGLHLTVHKNRRYGPGHRGNRKATTQLIKHERQLKQINVQIIDWIEEHYRHEKMA